MKKTIAILMLVSLFSVSLTQAVTLATYDIPTGTTSINSVSGTGAVGVTVGAIEKGSGLTLSSSTSGWRATSYNQTGTTSTSIANANANGDFWSFSLGAQTNYNVVLNGIGSLSFSASGSGASSWVLLYSTTSSFLTPTTVASFIGTPASATSPNVTTSWNSALAAAPITINSGNTAYFRIVGFGASSASGTAGLTGNLGTADFTLLGDIQSLLRSLTWGGGDGNWDTSSANWTESGSAATFAAGNDANIAGGTLTVASGGVTAGTIGVSGSSNTTLTGGGITATAISKIGGGTLNLNTIGTYSTGINIDGGTVLAGVNSALSGNVSVNGGGGLDVGATTNTVGVLSVTDGSISGSGKIISTSTAITASSGSYCCIS